jgi:hypothetical protein
LLLLYFAVSAFLILQGQFPLADDVQLGDGSETIINVDKVVVYLLLDILEGRGHVAILVATDVEDIAGLVVRSEASAVSRI